MFQIKQRHLPHWTQEGAVYFVTFHSVNATLSADEVSLVRNHLILGHDKYYRLLAVQVMLNHVHVILRPREGYTLARIMNGIKGVTSRLVNQNRGSRGHLWREESYDRIIRGEKELHEKMKYMYENPIKVGIVEDGSKYPGWFVPENE